MTPTRPPISGTANLRLFAVITITSAIVLQLGLFNRLMTHAASLSSQRSSEIAHATSINDNETLPILNSISPTSTTAGTGPLTLTVNGSNFAADATVRFNDIDRPTTFVDSTQLTTQLTLADLVAPGNVVITVVNPPPSGAVSNALNLSINCACGYEGDVNGDGHISIADWVLMGRIAAGLRILTAGCEFQRTDCAPRTTFGNGSISLSDWVQVGRWAAGLDVDLQCAAGPNGDFLPPPTQSSEILNPALVVFTGQLVPHEMVELNAAPWKFVFMNQ